MLFLIFYMNLKEINRPCNLEMVKNMAFYTYLGIIILFNSFNTLHEHVNFISTTNAAF